MEPLPPPGPPPPGFDMTGTAIPAVDPSPALSVGAMANSNLNAMDVEPIPESVWTDMLNQGTDQPVVDQMKLDARWKTPERSESQMDEWLGSPLIAMAEPLPSLNTQQR